MVSQTASSGFMVEFEDVKGKAEEEPLNGNRLFHLFSLTQEILVDVEGLGSLFHGFLAGI